MQYIIFKIKNIIEIFKILMTKYYNINIIRNDVFSFMIK